MGVTAASEWLWDGISGAASAAGYRVTVDAFATESNQRAPRCWSRYGEPGSEAVEALSVIEARACAPDAGGGTVKWSTSPRHLVSSVMSCGRRRLIRRSLCSWRQWQPLRHSGRCWSVSRG